MRNCILMALLLFTAKTFGQNITMNLSIETAQKLRDTGFAHAFSVGAQNETAVSSEIRASAEKRLLDVAASNLFSAAGRSPVLAAYTATSCHPDAFAVSAEAADGKITALVSEFQTDFSIIPGNPSRKDSEAARSEFRSWCSRLLTTAWQTEVTDERLEVLDQGDFFLVRKMLYDERGDRRFIPWTRSESLKMTMDKDGRWLILSVADLPDKVASMPAGGRGRSGGSWFMSPGSQKGVSEK